MFIFIYNTLVLDVKRINFEARMIDTLRSSSRVLFLFFLCTVCSSTRTRFLPILPPLPDLHIRYAATSDG